MTLKSIIKHKLLEKGFVLCVAESEIKEKTMIQTNLYDFMQKRKLFKFVDERNSLSNEILDCEVTGGFIEVFGNPHITIINKELYDMINWK